MNKRKLYDIVGSILFAFFCMILLIANIGNIFNKSKNNRLEAEKFISKINSVAPYQVGAERWFIGAQLIEDTLVYKYELRCNEETEKFYLVHKNDIRNLSLLTFKLMEKQNNKYASSMANILKNNHLVLKYFTVLPSLTNISYIYTADEIEKMAMDTSMKGEDVVMLYINMFRSYSLPFVMTESGEPIEGQPIELGDNMKPSPSKYLILNKIKLKENTVVFYYSTPEIKYPLSFIRNKCDTEENKKHLLDIFFKDPYFKELINYFVMAKCNIKLKYKGVKSLQTVDIDFPYQLLVNYSYIPKDLLDEI